MAFGFAGFFLAATIKRMTNETKMVGMAARAVTFACAVYKGDLAGKRTMKFTRDTKDITMETDRQMMLAFFLKRPNNIKKKTRKLMKEAT